MNDSSRLNYAALERGIREHELFEAEVNCFYSPDVIEYDKAVRRKAFKDIAISFVFILLVAILPFLFGAFS